MCMAASSGEPNVSREQRGALALLANFTDGITEELLVLAHGFDRALISGLLHEGLAMVRRETIETGGRTIEVVRLIITDVGRRAIQP
jgi:hypothetical protein